MTPAPQAAPFECSYPARASELRGIREAVRRACQERGAGGPCAEDVVIAVDEACQNIIRHGYRGEAGSIELRIEQRDDQLVVSIIDYAPEADPATVRGRALSDLRPGGLGTHLMRETMDRVEFAKPPPGCGNLLRMLKRIP